MYASLCHICAGTCLWGPEEGIRFPWRVVKGDCEAPDVSGEWDMTELSSLEESFVHSDPLFGYLTPFYF